MTKNKNYDWKGFSPNFRKTADSCGKLKLPQSSAVCNYISYIGSSIATSLRLGAAGVGGETLGAAGSLDEFPPEEFGVGVTIPPLSITFPFELPEEDDAGDCPEDEPDCEEELEL